MDVWEAIKNRRSVRAYADKAIPGDVLDRMTLALRSSPSACNYQPWHFIIVTDARLRSDIAALCNGQDWVASAAAIVVGCGFPNQAYKAQGGYDNTADIDVAIALDHLTLAAVADGLGSCWIGAYDGARVKALLDVPQAAKIVAMITLGYPATPGSIHALDLGERKPANAVISINRFSQS